MSNIFYVSDIFRTDRYVDVKKRRVKGLFPRVPTIVGLCPGMRFQTLF